MTRVMFYGLFSLGPLIVLSYFLLLLLLLLLLTYLLLLLLFPNLVPCPNRKGKTFVLSVAAAEEGRAPFLSTV